MTGLGRVDRCAAATVRFRRIPVAGSDHGDVRWHLRYALSYRDVEELLAERGIAVVRSINSTVARGS
jgi:hypothetical protein